MDILITGANGTVGEGLKRNLAQSRKYSFTYLDIEDHPDDETFIADMTDYEAIRPAFEEKDAVIHLALNPELNFMITEIGWTKALVDNLQGTVNVLKAALNAGIPKVVFASTIHVVGMYEQEYSPKIYDPNSNIKVSPTDPPRPDSLYGVAKVFGESLCQFCADWYDVSCYVLRFGGVMERETFEDRIAHGMENDEDLSHTMAVWFSYRDLGHMVDRVLQDDSVQYETFFGVSDNETKWVDISNAREILGYNPNDDSNMISRSY